MGEWKSFITLIVSTGDIDALREKARACFDKFGVYPDSINRMDGCTLFIARDAGKKVLVVVGESEIYSKLTGIDNECNDKKIKICYLTLDNCKVIRKFFPFTNPSNCGEKDISMGLGDRLGLASPAHIRVTKGKNIFPVLAQQSIRELNLTDRTYDDVLAAASWAVFQEGYKNGFGADGDHLKTPEEVKMALDCGYTMITLDCSEYIDNSTPNLSDEEVVNRYQNIEESERKSLEDMYQDKTIRLSGGKELFIPAKAFRRMVLVYINAIKYTIKIYNDLIRNCGRDIDFEMSIDETLTATSPEEHFFVASELIKNGVKIANLAPRFCGEFQKGIDYKGDVEQFEREFITHVDIANHFGYKISVHSGSDKFSVFPIIGEISRGRFHLKVAGTNWLEAVRVIAIKNPDLFRELYCFAVENLNEAKKYYVISAKQDTLPDIEDVSDEKLPELLDIEDSRQAIHITYGLLLQAKDCEGNMLFRDRIYNTLEKYEDESYKALEQHIGKHLDSLGIGIEN